MVFLKRKRGRKDKKEMLTMYIKNNNQINKTMNPDLSILLIVGMPILLAVIRVVWGDGRSNRPRF
jgi:hypothetical protein